MDTNSEIILLTPLQRAQKKYYEKRKNNIDYKNQIKINNKTYYDKVKVTPEFKEKVSIKKKEYYYANKKDILLDFFIV